MKIVETFEEAVALGAETIIKDAIPHIAATCRVRFNARW